MPSRHRETVEGGFDVDNVRSIWTRSSCAAAWVENVSSRAHTFSGTRRLKTIDDCTTPGYYAMLNKGRCLPNNPVTIVDTTETRIPSGLASHLAVPSGGCFRQDQKGPTWSRLSPDLVSVSPPNQDLIDLVNIQARAKCLGAIWDTLTSAAEMHKTVDMVANAWGRVFNFAERAAKFARRTRSRTYKHHGSLNRINDTNGTLAARYEAFNEKWLEYRYGWRPAILEAEDALKAYNAYANRSLLIVEKSSTTESLSDSDGEHTVTPISGGTQTLNRSEFINVSRRYTGTAWGYATNSGNKYHGFDPILTAWELVPYSFVFDWFYDIGTWVKAYSPFAGVKLKGASCSISEESHFRQSWDISWSGTGHSGSGGPVVTDVKSRRYERFGQAATSFPPFNPRLSTVKMIDLAALVLGGNRKISHLLRK